jgi:hypothetical protein
MGTHQLEEPPLEVVVQRFSWGLLAAVSAACHGATAPGSSVTARVENTTGDTVTVSLVQSNGSVQARTALPGDTACLPYGVSADSGHYRISVVHDFTLHAWTTAPFALDPPSGWIVQVFPVADSVGESDGPSAHCP